MFESFTDIQLDVPHAHTSLEKFTDMCARDGIIPISLTLKVPSRYETQSISKYCSPISIRLIRAFIHPPPPKKKKTKNLSNKFYQGALTMIIFGALGSLSVYKLAQVF